MTERAALNGPTRDLRAAARDDGENSPECLATSNATRDQSFDQESAVEAIKALQHVERLVVQAEPAVDRLIGQSIGKYSIESLLGRGGMGKVYRALQTRPVRRMVALKIMNLDVCGTPSSEQHARRRFVAEGQLLASLSHPDIASVYDADTTERGEPYFVMELVEGVPLTKFCGEHQLTIDDRVRLVHRICRIVHAAHQQGIVHRDLKPDNILVAAGDDGPEVKIIDFGIAKILEGHESIASGLTACDAFIGTPGYLSPEQATGSDVDARADVFSLGAILFQLLCGSTPINRIDTPFKDFSALRQLAKTYEVQRPSVRISSRDPQTQQELAVQCQTNVGHLLRQCRSDLDWVVLKALAPNRVDRYATALDLSDDLQRVLDAEPTHAAAPTYLYRLRKFAQRHPAQATAAAWVLVAAMCWFVRQQDLQHERLLQTASVAQDCGRLMDQVVSLRQSLHTRSRSPQGDLTTAAVKLEQTREMLDGEPTLTQARARRQSLVSSLDADEAAFDFVSSLDAARQMTAFDNKLAHEENPPTETARQALAKSFSTFRIDPSHTTPNAAAARLKTLPRILIPQVIESLDFWMGEIQSESEPKTAQWQFDVLVQLDPEANRSRLRVAILNNDAVDFRVIAEEGIDHQYLPFSRVQLASALTVAGHHPHALSVLRRAQQAHPENFWVNHHLAVALSIRGDEESNEEAIRFFSVASALRPDLAGPSLNLARLLSAMGRDDEARVQQLRAERLQADPANE